MRRTSKPAWEELRTKMRRAQILNAAMHIFADKGYHRTTTKDISRAAGVAEGTIYTYFETKADLLIALLQYLDEATTQSQDFVTGMEVSLRTFLIGRLEHDVERLGPRFDMLMAILPEVLVDPDLRHQFYDRLVAPALAQIEQHLQERFERGELAVTDIPMKTRLFIASLLGLEILYVLEDREVREGWKHPRQMAEQIAQVFLDGIEDEGKP